MYDTIWMVFNLEGPWFYYIVYVSGFWLNEASGLLIRHLGVFGGTLLFSTHLLSGALGALLFRY